MDIYVVRKGDTLYNISIRFGVSLSRLIADNGLTDPSQLVVGQTLVIRRPRLTHTVRHGETLSGIARQTGVSVRQLRRNNPSWRAAASSGRDRPWCFPMRTHRTPRSG